MCRCLFVLAIIVLSITLLVEQCEAQPCLTNVRWRGCTKKKNEGKSKLQQKVDNSKQLVSFILFFMKYFLRETALVSYSPFLFIRSLLFCYAFEKTFPYWWKEKHMRFSVVNRRPFWCGYRWRHMAYLESYFDDDDISLNKLISQCAQKRKEKCLLPKKLSGNYSCKLTLKCQPTDDVRTTLYNVTLSKQRRSSIVCRLDDGILYNVTTASCRQFYNVV